MNYHEFLDRKAIAHIPEGFKVDPRSLNQNLFPFQKLVVSRMLELGSSAGFLSTGLGKSIQQLAWSDAIAQKTDGRVLILAPLAVAKQTEAEAKKFGINVKYCSSMSDVDSTGIFITNYEKLHKFEPRFEAIACDESSVIKDSASQTFESIRDFCKSIRYKSMWTATPAPNDPIEIGCHAEVLGIMSKVEMLSTFFVHDGGRTSDWRLRGWAKDRFYEWLASWAIAIQKPSDLGDFDDTGYNLPALNKVIHLTDGKLEPKEGELIVAPAIDLSTQRQAKRLSLEDRCQLAAAIAEETKEQYLIFCTLNDESSLIHKLIFDSVEVTGSDSPEFKEDSFLKFASGDIRVLISKPRICGYGMNFQSCRNVIFAGIDHSWEQYYQAVRRVWRFGQKREVNCHTILSEHEYPILQNLDHKQKQADEMIGQLVKCVQKKADYSTVRSHQVEYNPQVNMAVPNWLEGEVA